MAVALSPPGMWPITFPAPWKYYEFRHAPDDLDKKLPIVDQNSVFPRQTARNLVTGDNSSRIFSPEIVESEVILDWSKFFFFSWLVSDNENEQLRQENEALRNELERLQLDEEDYYEDDDDHSGEEGWPP